jgi:hypothetical protein
MRLLLIAPNMLRRTTHTYSARRTIYAGTCDHPVKTEQRQRRAANAAFNFVTGHWQHRVVQAVPA